jgi:hypothetical protein
MFDVLVFVHRDAALARFDAIARELAALGLKVKASYASVGVIAGTVEERAVLARVQKIKDVTGVQEQGPAASAGERAPHQGEPG